MELSITIHETLSGSTPKAFGVVLEGYGGWQLKIPGTKLFVMLRDWIVKQWRALLEIRDKPHAIAGGVAIGIFFGIAFVPPPKTAWSLLTAWLCRCSKIAAVIAVTAHDILIPIAPFLFRWEYIIGYWVLHHQKPTQLRIDHKHFRPELLLVRETYHTWWRTIHEKMNISFFAQVIGPTLLGSVIIGIIAATICYLVVLRIATRAQAAAAKKQSDAVRNS